MTTEYTQNFRLNLPDFRMGPWHDLINEDFVTIDQLLMSIYQGVDTRPWTNNTFFEQGMTCIDTTDNTFWVCSVSHTSAPVPMTFAADRAAHPTYWARVVVGIAPRGEWQNATHYLPNDMVNSSDEGVIAVCNVEHTSSPLPATIRTDAAYWTFIADMSAGGSAAGIIYDNSISGVPATDVQAALDLNFAMDAEQEIDITDLENAVSALTTRMTNAEGVNTTQNTSINNNALAVSDLTLRVSAVEATDGTQNTAIATNTSAIAANTASINAINSAGYITDAPADGVTYGRKNHTWVVGGGGGTTVTVSDTPPATPTDNSLWWESDSGILFIRYNDGDSAQWVTAFPLPNAGAYVNKSGDTMTGILTLSADPTNNLDAATKHYVDNATPPAFPAGTVMLFYQTAAPTGWTKLTTQNDKALRVVSGSGGVAGGTNAFSTVMAQTVVGSSTLSIAQSASHTHTIGGVAGQFLYAVAGGGANLVGGAGESSGTPDSTGGGGTHNHTITMAIQYIDVILASKN